MPPSIATALCVAGILGLFWLAREPKASTSWALWIPVIWLGIACSRSVTDWLNMSTGTMTASQVLEGNPVDRAVYTVLLGAGVAVLCTRRKVLGILRANGPLLFFYGYCLFTIIWSDFPATALKRWPKALGDVVMVLVVLTDRQPLAAFRQVLERLAFVLIPLSVLFIKYIPQLGMGWNPWTGDGEYIGVTVNKNMLGAVCMVLGLGSLWIMIRVWKDRGNAQRLRHLIAHGVILAMIAYLFLKMNSMTSLSCFGMAVLLMVVASFPRARRRPMLVHVLLFSMAFVSVGILFLGLSPGALKAIGRNSTLTDRTIIWGQMLSQVRDPILGTGFESFWLGPRLDAIWRLNPVLRPNEAHNGYLEVYLNLGWVGIALLGFILGWGYRSVTRAWRNNDPRGALLLAYFFTALIYNCTEAAFFQMQAVEWLFFLFAIISAPGAFTRSRQAAAKANSSALVAA